MEKSIGLCPHCKRNSLVLEIKEQGQVIACWLCEYERPVLDEPKQGPVLPSVQDMGDGFFTTGPDYDY